MTATTLRRLREEIRPWNAYILVYLVQTLSWLVASTGEWGWKAAGRIVAYSMVLAWTLVYGYGRMLEQDRIRQRDENRRTMGLSVAPSGRSPSR